MRDKPDKVIMVSEEKSDEWHILDRDTEGPYCGNDIGISSGRYPLSIKYFLENEHTGYCELCMSTFKHTYHGYSIRTKIELDAHYSSAFKHFIIDSQDGNNYDEPPQIMLEPVGGTQLHTLDAKRLAASWNYCRNMSVEELMKPKESEESLE